MRIARLKASSDMRAIPSRKYSNLRIENSVPCHFHNLWQSKIARLAIFMGECGFVTLSSGEERSADGCTASNCECESWRMHRRAGKGNSLRCWEGQTKNAAGTSTLV